MGNSCFADLFGCHSKPFVPHEVVFAVSTCSIQSWELATKSLSLRKRVETRHQSGYRWLEMVRGCSPHHFVAIQGFSSCPEG